MNAAKPSPCHLVFVPFPLRLLGIHLSAQAAAELRRREEAGEPIMVALREALERGLKVQP